VAESADDLLQQLLAHISDTYDKTPGYITYDMLKSVALVLSGQLDRLDGIEDLLDVDNLTDALLEAFVRQRKGLTRNPATKARGVLLVSGNGTVTMGDLFESSSGVQFSATETKTISGNGQVNVLAMKAGASGNVPAGQITQIPVTIPGITSVTNPEPTHDGFEAETDDSLRTRYYVAVRTPPTSANVYQYLQWALEVPGVGAANVFPVERGPNTVEVIIIDQDRLPPSESLIDAVQSYIDPNSEGLGNGAAPIGAKCFVLGATALPLNINVTVQIMTGYTESEVQANIETSIREYLKGIAFQQNYVSHARIGESILNSEGVEDYSGLLINGLAENPQVGAKEVAVLGGVTLE
jgi:uncharacterized phage protein gp47/JayE